MLKDGWARFYLIVGALLLSGYVYAETRGVVIGGTDSRNQTFLSSGGGGRSGGWGYSGGYYGGK
jgi:hypothetical protein